MHAQKAVGQCTLRKPSGRVGAGLSMQMSRGLLKPELAPARATGAIADSEWPLPAAPPARWAARWCVAEGRKASPPPPPPYFGGVRARSAVERAVCVGGCGQEREEEVAGKRARRGCAGCG